MKLTVEYQSSYSRLELLARTIFGWLYIGVPHGFLLIFYSIYVCILMIYAWFAILFTTRFPKVAFDAYIGLLRWSHRLSASFMNLVDGYPPFGPGERWNNADIDVKYPEKVSRKRLLFISFLAPVILIPHIFVCSIRAFVSAILMFIAFFSVLITGRYPESFHEFVVGTLRLQLRIGLYSSFLYFKYPEFTGEETKVDRKHLK